MFWKKKTPRVIGSELSKRFRKSVESIRCMQSAEGIDGRRVATESAILVYVGCRFALYTARTTNEKEDRMLEICKIFDSHCFEFFPDLPEFRHLLYERGQQYLRLLQSDANWEERFQNVGYQFVQLCRGGGGGENDPLIVGDVFASMRLIYLASKCWSEGFVETSTYIENM